MQRVRVPVQEGNLLDAEIKKNLLLNVTREQCRDFRKLLKPIYVRRPKSNALRCFYQNGHRFECCALYAWPDKDDNLTALGASKGAVNIQRKNLPSH